MSTRKLIVTLEIEVKVLEGELLAESGYWEGFEFDDEEEDNPDKEAPTLDDYTPMELAAVIESDHPDMWFENFAGTGIYATFEAVKAVSADWSDAEVLSEVGGRHG